MEATALIYRFDNFTLDTKLVELKCGAEPRSVEPQVFNLLLHLIENREHVVSKDELIETVWGGRVVSDATIGSRINAARRAVGDSGKDQAIIKTTPRRGFRFVAEVLQDDAVPSNRPVSTLDEETKSEPSSEIAAEIGSDDFGFSDSAYSSKFVILSPSGSSVSLLMAASAGNVNSSACQ